MNGYAGSYQGKGRRAVTRQGWRTMSQTRGKKDLFWKTLGIMVLLAAVIGVAASYWVGHCIQQSLTGIAQAQELRSKKEHARVALLDEQARLLQFQRLEALAAVQVGLYSPGKRQQVGF